MAGGKAVPHDTLPEHTTPHDMRTSYATDTTAVGGEHAYNGAPHGTAVPYDANARRTAASGTF